MNNAIAANAHGPAFQELRGAKFTGHPWNEEIGVVVEERAAKRELGSALNRIRHRSAHPVLAVTAQPP